MDDELYAEVAERRAAGAMIGAAFFGMLAGMAWPQHLEWIVPISLIVFGAAASFYPHKFSGVVVMVAMLPTAGAAAGVLSLAEIRASEAAVAVVISEACVSHRLRQDNEDAQEACEQIAKDAARGMRDAGYAPPSWLGRPES